MKQAAPNQDTKRRKKVLYVITKSNFGGAQRYVYDLATNLPTDRFEPVVAFGYSGSSAETGKLAAMLVENNIRTITIPELARDIGASDLAALRALIKLFKTEKPDVVHLNSSKAGGLGSLAARIAGVPKIIFTAHGWPFREARNTLSKTMIWIASFATILFSHKVICVSEYDRLSFANVPIINKKLTMIHNGVAPLTTSMSKLEAQKMLWEDAPRDVVWIGSISELTRNKDIATAIEALNLLPHKEKLIYVVIGEGEEHAHLTALAQSYDLMNRIKFAGFIPDAARLLPAFDIFLMPSLKEGFPYAVLEAARAGVLVIASETGGIPEIIGNEDYGDLAKPGNAGQFARSLEYFIDHPQERQGIANRLQRAIDRFSIHSMLEKTFALYS